MIIARKYRKRPVVIDAVLWDGSTDAMQIVCGWVKDYWQDKLDQAATEVHNNGVVVMQSDTMALELPTLEGILTGQRGDYIIKGVAGEVYACKPEIFDKTYEGI